LDRSNK
jgi:hypothetical protein